MTETYIIHPILFYLAGIADTARTFLFALGITLFLGGVVFFIAYGDKFEKWVKDISYIEPRPKTPEKTFKKFIIGGIILISIGLFVPSKRTCIEMMTASVATYENINTVTTDITNAAKYVLESLQNK